MLLSHAVLLVVVPRRTARLRAAQTSLESLLGRVPGGLHAFFEPTRRRQGAPRAIRQTPSKVRLQTVTFYPQVNKSGICELTFDVPTRKSVVGDATAKLKVETKKGTDRGKASRNFQVRDRRGG
jgi:hypothetical protein